MAHKLDRWIFGLTGVLIGLLLNSVPLSFLLAIIGYYLGYFRKNGKNKFGGRRGRR